MTSNALSRIFSALADPTRRDMVARLSAGDATVNQLAEPYQLTLQAIYKHLKVLEDAGVVSRRPGHSLGRCGWKLRFSTSWTSGSSATGARRRSVTAASTRCWRA